MSKGWCTEGAKIIELCEKGDKLLDEEIAKVYKGKKITKGPFACLSESIFAVYRLFGFLCPTWIQFHEFVNNGFSVFHCA